MFACRLPHYVLANISTMPLLFISYEIQLVLVSLLFSTSVYRLLFTVQLPSPTWRSIYTGYPHSVLTFTNNPCLSLIENFHWNYFMSVYVFFIQNNLWLLLCGTVCSDYKLLNSTSSQINPVTCIVHTPSLLTSLNLRWDLCKYKFTNQNECQVNIFCCIKDIDQIWVFWDQQKFIIEKTDFLCDVSVSNSLVWKS